MEVAMARPLERPTGLVSSDELIYAMQMAKFAFSGFIQDTKDLIAQKVRSEIKAAKDYGSEPQQQLALTRGRALKKWLATQTPLSWSNNNGKTDNYATLLLLMHNNPDEPRGDLQKSRHSMTYFEMAEHMLQMTSQAQIAAPVVKDGYFIHILPLAVNAIKSKLMAIVGSQETSLVPKILAQTLKQMKIEFVPWHIENDNPRSNHRAVRYNWFLTLRSNSTTSLPLTKMLSPEESAKIQAQNLAIQHPDGAWEVPECLDMMGNLWNKNCLPLDWSIDYASLDRVAKNKPDQRLLVETYEYVRDNFSAKENPLHDLAMICGILFSRMAPNLYHSKEVEWTDIANAKMITDDIRALPWIKGTSSKGVKERRPLLTMMIAALVGLLDEQSPLAKQVARKGIIGTTWSTKHCK
jgi:hypothetical protein